MAYRVQAIQGVPYWVGEDSTVYMLPPGQRALNDKVLGAADKAGAAVLVPLGRYESETESVSLHPSWKELAAPSLLAYRQRLGDYTQEKLKESPPLVKVDKKPAELVKN
jgi:hypothetical protein